jgi:O-antigen ligase
MFTASPTKYVNRRDFACAAVIALSSAAIALVPSATIKIAAIATLAAAALLYAICLRPNRWLAIFFFADLLLPPVASSLGGSGIHAAAGAALLGLFAGALQLGEWDWRSPPLAASIATFSFSLAASVGFALVYSGPAIAAGSAIRIGLLWISFYIFLYAARGPRSRRDQPERFAAFLFTLALAASAFACLDFYFHFPAPAGFSDQYVWLSEGVFRRAQGLFYDASTLGNFCVFFLTYALIAICEWPRSPSIPRIGMILPGAALILSYSRASLVSFAVAAAAYAVLRGVRIGRAALAILTAAAVSALAIHFFFPSFAGNYWTRFFASIEYFAERPDSILSGRLTNWSKLLAFIAAHPWIALFGIGYKTLPYTSYLGDPLVADNTYLSLLVETGVAGLGSFLFLLAGILKFSFRAARVSFLGRWTFCFWCGQAVQMLSGDLLTYWRVLPLYFWILGAALRQAEDAS